MAKKFISFLGNSKYSQMTYSFNGKKASASFVQEAMLQLVCSDYSDKDTAYILVTDDAWNKNGETLRGLLENNTEINCKIKIKNIELPIEKRDNPESGVWHLFNIIYNEVLCENDAVTVDITNAFRYFPVIMMSVLNYAQYLKRIKINGIYYGAYEQRYSQEDEELEIEPIVDLTKTYEVMNWASAANTFTKYGIPDELSKQIREDVEFRIDEVRNLSKSLSDMANSLNYSRGKTIIEGTIFTSCKTMMDSYERVEIEKNPALSPILNDIKAKIDNFKENDCLNFIPAVGLLIEQGRPAEAISMLKEGITSYLLKKGNKKESKKLRGSFSEYLAYEGSKSSFYTNNEKHASCKADIENLMLLKEVQDLRKIVQKFNSIRNDIDHCGFGTDAKQPGKIKDEIKKAYDEVLNALGMQK